MDTFPLGGISKSLLALFNELCDNYEIDFLLMKREGIFVPLIPKNINVISNVIEDVFRNPHPCNFISNIGKLSTSRYFSWCTYSIQCCFARLTGGLTKFVNTMDVYIGKHSKPINKHYDAAIAYQGGRCIYYLIENVNADVKIGYVHNDYSASKVDWMLKPSDSKYFPKLDKIVTISPECLESLYREFPKLKSKCSVIGNICSPKMINSMANREKGFNDGFAGTRLVTMGRFDINQKGIDIAINACKILKERNLVFKWYLLGDGCERSQIEEMIRKNDVGEFFILLGAKTNPYPFIKDADIYVQPSRFEGKSVALDEVKAMAKPIVITNFSTVYDQFTNGITALVCKMEPTDIAEKIEQLMKDQALCDKLSHNLSKEKVGNEEQAEVFNSILERTTT